MRDYHKYSKDAYKAGERVIPMDEYFSHKENYTGKPAPHSQVGGQQQAAPIPEPQQAAPDNIPIVSSPADAAKLPPGTKFRDPQGNIRVVPNG